MTDMCHMDTDLVCPSSFWMEFDERPSVIISCFYDFIGRLGALSCCIDDHFCFIRTPCIETQDGSIDNSLSWLGHSDDESLVCFLDFTSPELFCHPFIGESIETRDDDPRRITIDTVGECWMGKSSSRFPSFVDEIILYLIDE